MSRRSAFRHDIAYSKRRQEPGVIIGVRNICRYMQIGPNTFYKLHTEHGLPAMQLPDGRWCTSRNLIDAWIVSRWKAQKGGVGHNVVETKDSQGVPALGYRETGAAPHMGREQAV